MNEDVEINYENKIVAFLDILGFKKAVTTKTAEDIFFALDIVKIQIEFQKEMRERYHYDENFIVQIFSDSIYFSYPSDRGWDLVRDVAGLMARVAGYGFYYRGGITYGKVFEDEKILFGPAIIEAYMLESQVAIYPRVIVSRSAINELKQCGNQIDFEKLIKVDKDGCQYIDFLTGDGPLYLSVEGIQTSLVRNYEEEVQKDSNEKTISKLVWLINNFNSMVGNINAEKKQLKEKCDPQIEKVFGFYKNEIQPIKLR